MAWHGIVSCYLRSVTIDSREVMGLERDGMGGSSECGLVLHTAVL
jgi:hypothetical protein